MTARRTTYRRYSLAYRLRLHLARRAEARSLLLARLALRYYHAADRMPPSSLGFQIHLLLWMTAVAVMLAALAAAIITNA